MMSNISSVLEQSPDIEVTKMVLEFVWDVTLLGASRGQMIKHRGLVSGIEELTQNADEEVASMAKNVIWSLKTPKEKGGRLNILFLIRREDFDFERAKRY